MLNSPRDGQGRHDGRDRRFGNDQRRQHTKRNDSRINELEIVLVSREGRPLAPDLFDGIANRAAEIVAREKTRNSQLRRFYDELLRWEEKVNGSDHGGSEGAKERLRKHLPFIRMMNAKAAYAKGRKLVGAAFVTMLRRCLDQVNDDPGALRNCRLFFEAFMGFYKLHGPQD